jgi:hypothetical protein
MGYVIKHNEFNLNIQFTYHKLKDIKYYKLNELKIIGKKYIKFYYKYDKYKLYEKIKMLYNLYIIKSFFIRYIGNILDPITKEPINSKNCFKYYYDNGKCVRYNIEPLIYYITRTISFKDPMTNIEFNKVDINRLNKLNKLNKLNEIDIIELFNNRENLRKRKNTDEDNILSIESILSDIVKEILDLVENPSNDNEIINMILQYDDIEYIIESSESDSEFLDHKLLPVFSQYIQMLEIMTSKEHVKYLILSFIEYITGPKNKENNDPNNYKKNVISFMNELIQFYQ